KAAAVSLPLRERHEELLVHTGQHHDDELSRIFFDELGIPAPDRQPGAPAAAHQPLPTAHVEAGTRSFDRTMPEELNRVLTDHASDLLLCSTDTAVANLERESAKGVAHLVGDVMADVSLAFRDIAEERSRALEEHGLEPG